ncbi:hypothetical protein OA93_04610 [Flavobacterium sp. KMS]|uniref:hypothetical protein n=1 Tax=Flavobacterium sp. KMS TaxID=1566023 RepID=UPI0005805A00|nr:hypothetical protein [Flavobacterium sp. KMS]KIA99452.1 hypothetical protein OA93_04610 [Flavobacterium sp. KMS]
MTIANLNSAMEICNQGLLEFNKGNAVRAFFYKGKWYPLRATVNKAKMEAGENELITDRALVELAYLLPYIKIEDKAFIDNFPIKIDDENRFQEINYLSDLISKLTI